MSRKSIKVKCWLLAAVMAPALSAAAALASDAEFHFKLPNCPSEMDLSAPDAFRDAVAQEDLLKAYQPFMIADTQGVFAARSPKRPDLALLAVEPNRVREVQGTITPEQFAKVKEAMLAKNPSNAVVEANEILEGKDTSIDEYDGIVQSSTETSATVTLVLDGTTTGAGFTSLTGFKMIYAHKCLLGVILIAPRVGVARRDFEEMIQQIVIE